MGSDAIVNARVCASYNKNSSKKKRRGSKQRKSKQNIENKIDDRRGEQIVDKEYIVENSIHSNAGEALPQSIQKGRDETNTQGNDEIPIICSSEAVIWTNDSGVRRPDCNSLSKEFYGRRISRGSGSCSSSCSGEYVDDDECLDDWEAVTDALNTENNRQASDLEHYASKKESSGVNCQYQENRRAWSAGDVYRPRNLPNIRKQQYNRNQLNSEHCFSRGPSACPICCEDFDVTDMSFLPCPCGFQLCLFCHKRILEVDRRCPGCRKQYDSVEADAASPVQMTHSSNKTWFK